MGHLRETLRHTVLLIVSALTILPFLLLVFNAVKPVSEFARNPFGPPRHLALSNFVEAWTRGNYGQAYLNSIIVGLVCIIVIGFVSGLAAYALSKMRFKSAGAIMGFILFTMSIPLGMFLVPLFFIWQRIHLMNSLYGLIIIYCGIFLSFNIFLLRSYFVGIPGELREAALVEGANEFQVFMRIMVPLAKPAFLSVSLIIAVWTWNEFFFANAFLQSNHIKTVAIRYLVFTGEFSQNWALISAGGLISIAPIIVIYLLLQRRFIQGIVDGSVKG